MLTPVASPPLRCSTPTCASTFVATTRHLHASTISLQGFGSVQKRHKKPSMSIIHKLLDSLASEEGVQRLNSSLNFHIDHNAVRANRDGTLQFFEAEPHERREKRNSALVAAATWRAVASTGTCTGTTRRSEGAVEMDYAETGSAVAEHRVGGLAPAPQGDASGRAASSAGTDTSPLWGPPQDLPDESNTDAWERLSQQSAVTQDTVAPTEATEVRDACSDAKSGDEELDLVASNRVGADGGGGMGEVNVRFVGSELTNDGSCSIHHEDSYDLDGFSFEDLVALASEQAFTEALAEFDLGYTPIADADIDVMTQPSGGDPMDRAYEELDLGDLLGCLSSPWHPERTVATPHASGGGALPSTDGAVVQPQVGVPIGSAPLPRGKVKTSTAQLQHGGAGPEEKTVALTAPTAARGAVLNVSLCEAVAWQCSA